MSTSNLSDATKEICSFYHPNTEKGFCWKDPTLSIPWPIPPRILSERDKMAPLFTEVFL